MRKRITIILLMLVAVAVQGMAQEIKVPKWEKFVRIERDGVSLRKEPNATSPQLMIYYTGDVNVLTWSPKADSNPYCFAAGNIVPVIDVAGKWYHVYVDVYGINKKMDAYISAEFCNEVVHYYPDTGPLNGVIEVGGKNGLYVLCEEMGEGETDYYIGKKFGLGIVGFEYAGLNEFFMKACGSSETYNVNKKITEAQLLNFMKTHKGHPCRLTYGFDSRSNISWNYDAGTYPFSMISKPQEIRIKKFVKSASGKGLIMYKEPNVKSSKLMLYRLAPTETDAAYDLVENDDTFPYTIFDCLGVTGEVGEWYSVFMGTHWSQCFVGYVKKSECKDVLPKAITPGMIRSENEKIYTYAGVNYLFSWWGDKVKIYKIIGNIPKRMSELQVFIDKARRELCLYTGNAGRTKDVIKGTRFLKPNNYGGLDVDLRSLNQNEVSTIIRNVHFGECCDYIWINFDGSGDLTEFKLGTYNGKEVIIE